MGIRRKPIFVSLTAHEQLVQRAYEQRCSIESLVDVLLGIKTEPTTSTSNWWDRHPRYRTTVDSYEDDPVQT